MTTPAIKRTAKPGRFCVVGFWIYGKWDDKDFATEKEAVAYATRQVIKSQKRPSNKHICMLIFDDQGNQLHLIGEIGK